MRWTFGSEKDIFAASAAFQPNLIGLGGYNMLYLAVSSVNLCRANLYLLRSMADRSREETLKLCSGDKGIEANFWPERWLLARWCKFGRLILGFFILPLHFSSDFSRVKFGEGDKFIFILQLN